MGFGGGALAGGKLCYGFTTLGGLGWIYLSNLAKKSTSLADGSKLSTAKSRKKVLMTYNECWLNELNCSGLILTANPNN